MAQDNIIAQIGHPILRKKTKNVPLHDIKTLMIKNSLKKLIKVMRKAKGLGLAANQIFYPYRICVIESLKNQRYKHFPNISLKVLINPTIEILNKKHTFQSFEGCLSVPLLRGMVTRYKKIKVDYFNSNAERVSEIIDGLASAVYQHEIDHLNGILFTDRVCNKKSLMTLKTYKEFYEKDYIKLLKQKKLI